jgi:hypothetical protein
MMGRSEAMGKLNVLQESALRMHESAQRIGRLDGMLNVMKEGNDRLKRGELDLESFVRWISAQIEVGFDAAFRERQ